MKSRPLLFVRVVLSGSKSASKDIYDGAAFAVVEVFKRIKPVFEWVKCARLCDLNSIL